MSGALLAGLLGAELLRAEEVLASDVRPERLAELSARYGIGTIDDNRALVAAADVVILGVKPQGWSSILEACGSLLRPTSQLVSILAGVSTGALEAALPEGARVVRVMPNAPAMIRAGATAVAPGRSATEEDVALVKGWFEAIGQVVVLEERLLDAVTAVSGSGPAYVLLFIEALADAGVNAGLPVATARLLAAQTVYGTAKLLQESGRHPAELKETITSPGGTTIAGLHQLEAGGVRAALFAAVQAATQRAQDLGGASASLQKKVRTKEPGGG